MLLSRRARQLLRQLRSDDQSDRDDQPEEANAQAEPPASPGARSVVERAAQAATRRSRAPVPPPPPSGPLAELVPGRALERPEGAFYLVQAAPAEVLPQAARMLESLPEALGSLSAASDDARLALLRQARPEQLALLDIETAGLSAAPIFLVGLMLWPDDRPDAAVVCQLMARDYAEEAAMLAEAARLLAGRRILISYNGRSFDLPLVQERLVYHRLGRLRAPECHLDLLPVVRRRFRGRWEDCRLQTLEKHLCGRERWGDIEGADIPQAYHDFVSTGDAGQMKLVIEHNRLDLIAMLEILFHLRR
jgi:uncharacterized protein YprB with RNaseH-like and TPR domain